MRLQQTLEEIYLCMAYQGVFRDLFLSYEDPDFKHKWRGAKLEKVRRIVMFVSDNWELRE